MQNKTKNFFRVSAEDFKKIPSSPIAYWLSVSAYNGFFIGKRFSSYAEPRLGMATGDNNTYVRFWPEVSTQDIGLDLSRQEAKNSHKKWFPYNKGGEFRRWYGNNETVVNWENDGILLQTNMHPLGGRIWAHNFNLDYIFKQGITWTFISSSSFGVRFSPKGFLFDVGGSSAFPSEGNIFYLLGFLGSSVTFYLLKALNPTLNFQAGNLSNLPIIPLPYDDQTKTTNNVTSLIENAKSDWDSYETSWDFQENPLIAEAKMTANPSKTGRRFLSDTTVDGQWIEASMPLSGIYILLRRKWQRQTEEMRKLEIENNRIFIDAYGLQDELSPEVPWNEITLTCNPWYRYGKSPEAISVNSGQLTVDRENGSMSEPSTDHLALTTDHSTMPKDSQLEARLLEDTIKEFISYAVGCMMGRYSPEKPGLILANQGESFDDFIVKTVDREQWAVDRETKTVDREQWAVDRKNGGAPESTTVHSPLTTNHYLPDRDGVIPILDEEWFVDDIVAQFKQFLRFTFGAEHFADNLDFIEKALGKDIRKYFIKDFYKDHVQRYKKRPIYWMFSSPKGSFNALIYMHRYRPDTVSIVLNEYLREFISKIRSHREHLITENNRATLAPAEKTRNLKLIDKYAAMLTELDAYERDILYPLAQQKIAIDLDDGVKVNYCKFGAALKKIPGLEAKEE